MSRLQGAAARAIPIDDAEALRTTGVPWRLIAKALNRLHGEHWNDVSVKNAVLRARREQRRAA